MNGAGAAGAPAARRPRPRPLALVAAFAALAAGPARANGRFPQASQPVLHPRDPARLALRTTFGALASDDGGRTFRWICETVAGYGGVQDPAIALFGGPAIAFAVDEGLSLSHDGGCSFARPPGLPAAPARDVALDRGRPDSLAALVTPAGGRAEAYVSDDGARSWRPAGPPLPEGFEAETLEIAGARLYVSGASGPAGARLGRLARLAEGDGEWLVADVALEGEASLYLAALDPSDPARLYARADGLAGDRLLASEDGGATFRTILRSAGRLLGLAVSPDGAKVAAGGPGVGVLVAGRGDFVFTKKSDAGVLGLAWGAGGLFAAANEFSEGYLLARSGDEGASFEPLLANFADVAGPLEGCPAVGPYASTCVAEWPALRRELGGERAGEGGEGGGEGGGALGGGPGAEAARARGGACAASALPSATARGALLAAAALALGRAARGRRRGVFARGDAERTRSAGRRGAYAGRGARGAGRRGG